MRCTYVGEYQHWTVICSSIILVIKNKIINDVTKKSMMTTNDVFAINAKKVVEAYQTLSRSLRAWVAGVESKYSQCRDARKEIATHTFQLQVIS